jgi:Glycosyltransferase
MKKRIALISDHASPLAALGGTDRGGQNVYVANLALELAERGHFVDVFTRRESTRAPTVIRWAPRVRVVHVDAGPSHPIPKEALLPHMEAFATFIITFGERQHIRYDVCHANFWTSGVAARLVKHATDTPFVVTFHALGRVRVLHQGAADHFPSDRGRIEEALIAEADAVIAECPQDADDLSEHYSAPRQRMRVVPCGVDCRLFHDVGRDRARRVLQLPGEQPILLQLGRLVPRKGIDDVIRSVAELRRRHAIDARLIIVGGDSHVPDEVATPHLRDLRRTARDHDVDDAVQFVGQRGGDVLRYYYSAADVFVTTPWYEPFGITPLEAMACGTPVIGTNVGGIKFTVVDGETGYLVPPRDPGAIAARAAGLLRNGSLRQQMSAHATARVRAHFRWTDVAAAIDALYDDVIRQAGLPSRARASGSEGLG